MRTTVITILAAILLAFPAAAQKTVKKAVKPAAPVETEKKEILDRSKQPSPGPAPVIKIGEAQSFTLDNGLKVFVVENHKIPRVSYSLVLDIYPVLEGDMAGYSNLAGELMRTGTTTRTKDQIDAAIDFIGANLNTSPTGLNASCLTKHNEKLLELMSDILLNAQFKDEELEKIRTQTISGLETEKNDPSAIASRVSDRLIYSALHPYGENMTIESVKKITLGKCREYYTTFFKPNAGYLAIVGDITLDEAKLLTRKYLGSWQSGEVPPARFMMPKAPAKATVAMVDRPSAVQSTLNVCYPVDLKPGSPDEIKAKVTNTILGGGSFRLFNNLREKHSWTYGAYSSLVSDRLAGHFTANAEVRNPVSDSAISEILGEMNRIRTEPVPEVELTMVKNYMSGNFGRALENPSTVANFAINTARYKLPKDYYANYLTNLMAVTPSDVQMMAQKYIRPDNSYILVVGKAEEVAPKIKQFAKSGEIQYYDFEGVQYDPSKKLTPAPAGVTAETVINKYVEAIGGAKKIKKIKDMTVQATTIAQGQTINFDSYLIVPDKFMLQIGSGPMVFGKQIYNAGKGITDSPMSGEKKPVEEAELINMKEQALLISELYYGELGFKTELAGIEEQRSGDKWYKVVVTKPGDVRETNYFDVNTGLKVRTESKQSVVAYSDYKPVNGVLFPFTVEQNVESQSIKLTVTGMVANSKLKADLFMVE